MEFSCYLVAACLHTVSKSQISLQHIYLPKIPLPLFSFQTPMTFHPINNFLQKLTHQLFNFQLATIINKMDNLILFKLMMMGLKINFHLIILYKINLYLIIKTMMHHIHRESRRICHYHSKITINKIALLIKTKIK